MCPSRYHHHGFMATHPLGHIMYGCTLLVPLNYYAHLGFGRFEHYVCCGLLMATYIMLLA